MFGPLFKKFERLYNKKIDGEGLAAFRIVYSIVFLGEVLQMCYFRHLVFDRVPYVVLSEIDYGPIFVFWTASILFLIVGLYTRIAALINYIFTVIIFGTATSFEYHMFYTYIIVNFFFIFLPISTTFSLDRLLKKLKYSNAHLSYTPSKKVSVLSYYILVLFGIGLVYFDSVFFKLTSTMWLRGLGLWLPGSLPQAVVFNNSYLLNSEFLIKGLGYLTLLFEMSFLFLFWIKKMRIPLAIIGVGLHIGILIFFPIPFFAFGFVALYILMVPTKVWKRFLCRRSENTKSLKVYYDSECPLCNRIRIIVNHFDFGNSIKFLTVQDNFHLEPTFTGISSDTLLADIHCVDAKKNVHRGLDTYIKIFSKIWCLRLFSWFLRMPLIYHKADKLYRFIAFNRVTHRCTEETCGIIPSQLPVEDSEINLLSKVTLKDAKLKLSFVFLMTLLLLQGIVSYNSPLLKDFRSYLGISNRSFIRITEMAAKRIGSFSKIYFGITHHGVFVDSHFRGYNHSIAVVFEEGTTNEKWLPIMNQAGMIDSYLLGPVWAKWTFRSNSPDINPITLANSVRDFTAFWAYQNNIKLDKAIFNIKVKRNKEPSQWEYDFLNKQLNNPWLDGGYVEWKDKQFISKIKDIEKI